MKHTIYYILFSFIVFSVSAFSGKTQNCGSLYFSARDSFLYGCDLKVLEKYIFEGPWAPITGIMDIKGEIKTFNLKKSNKLDIDLNSSKFYKSITFSGFKNAGIFLHNNAFEDNVRINELEGNIDLDNDTLSGNLQFKDDSIHFLQSWFNIFKKDVTFTRTKNDNCEMHQSTYNGVLKFYQTKIVSFISQGGNNDALDPFCRYFFKFYYVEYKSI